MLLMLLRYKMAGYANILDRQIHKLFNPFLTHMLLHFRFWRDGKNTALHTILALNIVLTV